MHISRRRIGGLLATLTVLVAPLATVTFITAGPASASCPGFTCSDNSDPMNTHCWDANAYVAKHGSDGSGNTLKLWYSPDCGTNWAEDISNGEFTTEIWTATQTGHITSIYSFKFDGQAWSNQLNAATVKADACIDEYIPQLHRYAGIECVGQYYYPDATMLNTP